MIVFVSVIVNLSFLYICQLYVVDWELASSITIAINSVMVYFLLYKKYNSMLTIIYLGYILRVLVVFIDFYCKDYIPILHSGADTEKFHLDGISIFLDNATKSKYGTYYSNFVGYVYSLVGPQRLLAQYVNVILGVSIVCYAYRIMTMLKVDEKYIYLSMCILSFLPHSIILSSVLLRESIVTFSATVSVFYFTRWYIGRKHYDFIGAILFCILGAIMHSGIIFLIPAYFIGLILLSKKSASNIFFLTVGISCMTVLAVSFPDLFFSKFSLLDKDSADVYESLSEARGGSQYLSGVQMNSPMQIIIYSPLKMFYFLFSPMPWNWRGVMDIIMFVGDSLVYIYMFLIIFRHRQFIKISNYKEYIHTLLIGVCLVVFVFAFGTKNAGTAARHRNKILPLIVISYGLVNTKTSALKDE